MNTAVYAAENFFKGYMTNSQKFAWLRPEQDNAFLDL